MEKKISIFIPAFNAAKHIKSVINRIPSNIRASVVSVHIINDGSVDNTAEVVSSLCKKDHRIKPLHFSVNKGYGMAVKTGLQLCREDGCDYAVCIHADGQYPPELIENMVCNMDKKKIDIMQGSRVASGTALSGGMPLYKYVAGRSLTVLENMVFGLKLSDYHSGYLLYSRRALNSISFEKLSASFDFDLEVIASARASGFTVDEYPIPTRYADEVSYLNPLTYGFRVLGVLLRYCLGKY